MTEEKLTKAIELEKRRRKLLKDFRSVLQISDPYFRPTEYKDLGDGEFEITNGEKIHKYKFQTTIKAIDKTTSCQYGPEINIPIHSAAREWIESIIEGLRDVNTKIQEL